MQYNLVSLLNDRENKIIYDKNLRKITGSLTSAILLQQMIYWSEKKKGGEFYKFRTKCSHELYKEGDSWCEELGFDEYEFDLALKSISFKLGKRKNIIKKEEALVVYRYSKEKLTYYKLNYELINKKLSTLIELRNIKLYKSDEIINSISVQDDGTLINTETTSETTTKTTFSKENKGMIEEEIKNHNLAIINKKTQKNEILNFLEKIKKRITNKGFLYNNSKYEYARAKNILYNKPFGDFADTAKKTREEAAFAVIDQSMKYSFWRGQINSAEMIYKHYTKIYNLAIQDKLKNTTITL